MKDWYMILVFLAILVTPFLPFILKAKCPACGKRKLESLDTAESPSKSSSPYISYFYCGACHCKFVRDKSGPIQPLPDESAVDRMQV
jgi:hypothetical protein